MRKLLLAAVVIGMLAAASPHAEEQTRRKIRIVSLAPSITEMFFSLGVGDQVIGATDYCNYPPEAKKIPRVGGLGQPNVEKIISMAPDLVVYTDLERDEIADVLREAGITVLELKIRDFA
jgi:iron complex transport system substrate-binding protein